jgi:hypothetical protein
MSRNIITAQILKNIACSAEVLSPNSGKIINPHWAYHFVGRWIFVQGLGFRTDSEVDPDPLQTTGLVE